MYNSGVCSIYYFLAVCDYYEVKVLFCVFFVVFV